MHDFKTGVWTIIFVFVATVLALNVAAALAADDDAAPGAVQTDETPDIEWFKQELKIDPKYTEQSEGILGMSWAHFLTMTFLVLFFFGALMAYHRRTTRTTRILEQLLKED